MMEAESGFLSKDDGKGNVFKFLQKVLSDLNVQKKTTITEGETTIQLKTVTHFTDPPPIHDFLVPLLSSRFQKIPLEAWDLTTQQVQ